MAKNIDLGLKIVNNGRHISSTNYYQTEMASRGLVAASLNARTFRLLIPPRFPDSSTDAQAVTEMTRGVKYVIASRGAIGNKKVIELIFEDNSQSPYMLTLDYNAFDVLPNQGDDGREDLTVVGYVSDTDGSPREVFDLLCKFRWSDGHPNRKPWNK